ncbi:MAG: hypothetical protein Q7R90_05090 [bacterium]|nr:hypothetical protein [bacterium]
MSIKFIDSQTCEIDGEQKVFLRDSLTVFKNIHETLKRIGPEKFYSSPDNDVKRIRESLAELFFLLAVKDATKSDWYLLQPNEDFPDFFLMSMNDGDRPVDLHGFELTEVPPRIETFNEAMKIVNFKLQKGYSGKYNLLIYLNNTRGLEFARQIEADLPSESPFKEIWTVRMLSKNNNTEISHTIANRLRPHPILQWVANFDDPQLFRSKEIPKFAEILETESGPFVSMKRDFVNDYLKKVRRYLLEWRKKKNT